MPVDNVQLTTVVRLRPNPGALSDQFEGKMAIEIVNYNGYRLEVVPVGKGWRVSIYPPDSTLALRESPSVLEKVLKETVIAEAKKIVDAQAATN
jgi:hypothetical protein